MPTVFTTDSYDGHGVKHHVFGGREMDVDECVDIAKKVLRKDNKLRKRGERYMIGDYIVSAEIQKNEYFDVTTADIYVRTPDEIGVLVTISSRYTFLSTVRTELAAKAAREVLAELAPHISLWN